VWANVPVGATPDNIAVCCTADQQVLADVCQGQLATCLCQIPGGCGGIPEGTAVGILDEAMQGSPQATRFTPDAVQVVCTSGSGDKIVVQPDLTNSYWNPSGFQQAPASCTDPPCYDEVGPAIVFIPETVPPPPASGGSSPGGASAMVPTNTTCSLRFAADVVDKENTQVCAPPMGRPASCDDVNLDQCTGDQDCTPGDVSAFSFGTSALSVSLEGINTGDTGIDPTTDIFAATNAPLAAGSIANIQITEQIGSGPVTTYTQYTVSLTDARTVDIHPTNPAGFDQNATYTITFPTTFADYYNQGLPAPVAISFTTGT
jgi:hypothetical protein